MCTEFALKNIKFPFFNYTTNHESVWGMEVQLHAFLTTALDGLNGHLHRGTLYIHCPKTERQVSLTEVRITRRRENCITSAGNRTRILRFHCPRYSQFNNEISWFG